MFRFAMFWIVLLVPGLAVAAWPTVDNFTAGTDQQFKGTLGVVKVTRVIDGDTFVAQKEDGTEIKVRLFAVDAPELDSHSVEATYCMLLLQLVFDAREFVLLESDPSADSDPYGRKLRWVWIKTGPGHVSLLQSMLVTEALAYGMYPECQSDFWYKAVDSAKTTANLSKDGKGVLEILREGVASRLNAASADSPSTNNDRYDPNDYAMEIGQFSITPAGSSLSPSGDYTDFFFKVKNNGKMLDSGVIELFLMDSTNVMVASDKELLSNLAKGSEVIVTFNFETAYTEDLYNWVVQIGGR